MVEAFLPSEIEESLTLQASRLATADQIAAAHLMLANEIVHGLEIVSKHLFNWLF